MSSFVVDDMTVHRIELPVPGFRTAHESFGKRPVVLVRLDCVVDGESVVGWGEAAPLPEWGTESIAEVEEALVSGCAGDSPSEVSGCAGGSPSEVSGCAGGSPASRNRGVNPRGRENEMTRLISSSGCCVEAAWVAEGRGHKDPLPSAIAGESPVYAGHGSAHPITQFALETALLDAHGRATGVGAGELLSPDGTPDSTVAINATLGADDAVADLPSGVSAIKMKVGTSSIDDDLGRVRRLRDALPDETALRLDANGAWSVDEARRFLDEVAALDIEYVEQPVARDERDALVELARHSQVDIAADESAHPIEHAREFVESGDIPVLVLKPMALGGLTAARELAVEAAERGVRVVWTSAIESAVGRSAVAHLAASLPAGGPHGLGTGQLLEEDVAATPDEVVGGKLHLREGPGLGVEVDPDAVGRLSVASNEGGER